MINRYAKIEDNIVSLQHDFFVYYDYQFMLGEHIRKVLKSMNIMVTITLKRIKYLKTDKKSLFNLLWEKKTCLLPLRPEILQL